MRKTKYIVLLAMCSALLLVVQMMLSFLPNVELVTLLLFIYCERFGLRFAITSSLIFSTLMGIVWGFGSWIILYYVVWTLLVSLMAIAQKKLKNDDHIAFFLAFLGLLFGLLSSLFMMFMYQSATFALAYFLNGIMFDLVHAFSNYILALVLYNKVSQSFQSIKHTYFKELI